LEVLQAGRLLQSVALCRTRESKGSSRRWQFDCFYRPDKRGLWGTPGHRGTI